VTYSSTYPDVGFGALGTLGGTAANCTGSTYASSANACLIDDVLATTTVKSGYNFTATAGTQTPSVTYTSLAVPSVLGQSGQRAFCSDESGVIRFNPGGVACANTDSAL
jgi:hypothetical protein